MRKGKGKKGQRDEEEDLKHPNNDPRTKVSRKKRRKDKLQGIANSEHAKNEDGKKSKLSKVRKMSKGSKSAGRPRLKKLLSLAMRFRTRFLKPFPKEKIGVNPRSCFWLTRQIRTKTLVINQSRGCGCHRQVKVALTLIAEAKLRERRARVALTMILNKKQVY